MCFKGHTAQTAGRRNHADFSRAHAVQGNFPPITGQHIDTHPAAFDEQHSRAVAVHTVNIEPLPIGYLCHIIFQKLIFFFCQFVYKCKFLLCCFPSLLVFPCLSSPLLPHFFYYTRAFANCPASAIMSRLHKRSDIQLEIFSYSAHITRPLFSGDNKQLY